MNETRKQSPVVVLVVMLLAMIAGSLCMNKVSPILTQIMASLSVTSQSKGGLLITIFVLSGIFLAVPVGVLVTKLGIFKTGIIALLSMLLGSVIGALPVGYWGMLASRLIEGVGLVLLGAAGPVAVANAYAGRNKGAAIGLLMCYMSFGRIIALNIAPAIAEAGSWRNVWWLSAGYSAVVLVLWLCFMRGVDVKKKAPDASAGKRDSVLISIVKNKSVMLLCVTFFLYCLTHFGAMNALPTYLSSEHGLSSSAAGLITSITSIIGIPIGILGGWVADKLGSRKKPLVVMMLVCAVNFALIPLFPTNMLVLMSIFYGIATMTQAGMCTSAVTEVVNDPSQSGMAVALLNMFMWIGSFFSSPFFGALVDTMSWQAAFYVIAPIVALGAVTTLLNKRLK